MMKRNYRSICDDGNMAACLSKDTRCFPCLVLKLELGSMSEGRAYCQRNICFLQCVYDQVAFCYMLKSDLKTKFLCNAECGTEIVCLMSMSL